MKSAYDYSHFWSPAFDTMEDFIFLIDEDFNIIKVNKSFLDFSNKKEEFFKNKKCYEVVHGTDEPVKECPHARLVSSGKYEHGEFYDVTIKKWLYVRVTPIFDDKGGLVGSIHIASDITQRKNIEEAVRENEARYRTIFDSSSDAIIGKTLDGTIMDWNAAAEKMYGYKKDEVIGKNISILTSPDRPDEIPAILNKIRLGKVVERFETVRRKKDGSPIYISLTISPIKDAAGNAIGASTMAHDITERKKIEEDLKKKMESLERFQKITVDRELRMKELKAKLAELEAKTRSGNPDSERRK